jgi:hypothetical protein
MVRNDELKLLYASLKKEGFTCKIHDDTMGRNS